MQATYQFHVDLRMFLFDRCWRRLKSIPGEPWSGRHEHPLKTMVISDFNLLVFHGFNPLTDGSEGLK